MDTIEPLFARLAGKQGLTEKTAKWVKGSQVVQKCSFLCQNGIKDLRFKH